MRDIDYRIAELAKPYLSTRKNDIHVEVSLQFAVKLLESEPGDPEIVIPAILCHDLGWSKVPEELQLKAFGPTFDPDLQRIHEVEGVKLAQSVLQQLEYDPQKTAEILEIIDGHDSRIMALSASDKLVKDADKLFRVTPVGLRINAERFEIEVFTHANWLRGKLDEWFFTDTAKKLALEELAKSEE